MEEIGVTGDHACVGVDHYQDGNDIVPMENPYKDCIFIFNYIAYCTALQRTPQKMLPPPGYRHTPLRPATYH